MVSIVPRSEKNISNRHLLNISLGFPLRLQHGGISVRRGIYSTWRSIKNNSEDVSAEGRLPPLDYAISAVISHTSDDVVWNVNYDTLFGQVGGYGDR